MTKGCCRFWKLSSDRELQEKGESLSSTSSHQSNAIREHAWSSSSSKEVRASDDHENQSDTSSQRYGNLVININLGDGRTSRRRWNRKRCKRCPIVVVGPLPIWAQRVCGFRSSPSRARYWTQSRLELTTTRTNASDHAVFPTHYQRGANLPPHSAQAEHALR